MAEPFDVAAAVPDGAPILILEEGYVHLRDSRHCRKRGMWIYNGGGRTNDLYTGDLVDEELAMVARIALGDTDFLERITIEEAEAHGQV